MNVRVRLRLPAVEPEKLTPVAEPGTEASGESRQFSIIITASVSGVGAMRVARTIDGTAFECIEKIAKEKFITLDKNQVPLLSAVVLRHDLPSTESVSKKESATGVQLVILDYDSETQNQIDTALAGLRDSGFVHYAYPTYSWTAVAPRWRIVVFLSRVVPIERYAAVWFGLGNLLGTHGDESAKKPAQRYYLPSCPPGEENTRPKAVDGGYRLADPDQLDPPQSHISPDTPGTAARAIINDDILHGLKRADNRDRDAGLIAKECPLLAALFRGDPLAYPEWRATAGILKFCRDGGKHFHRGSALDPRSGTPETQALWDGYPDKIPPTRCGSSTQYCGGCKHKGKLSSPVQLGDIAPDPVMKPHPNDANAVRANLKAADVEWAMDQDSRLVLIVPNEVNGRAVKNVHDADSEAASDAILAITGETGRPPADRTIQLVKASEHHRARQLGSTVSVHLRVAQSGEAIYQDLGPGRVVRVDDSGVRLEDDRGEGVPLFKRGMGVGQLPDPEFRDTAPSALRFLVKTLRDEFGLDSAQALISIATLLEWLRPSTAHPVLELLGPAGSGKSTLGDFFISVIDPAGDSGRVTIGIAVADIAAAAQQRYLLPIDNAGKLDAVTSNLLCIVSTGGSLLVRLLYTNGEIANLKLHRPVLITAVWAVCTAPDLQSRVNRIELVARTGGYTSEQEIKANLDKVRPRVLGALYTLLSGALRELPKVTAEGKWGHRLVSLDQIGEAAIAAAGVPSGTFLRVIGDMRERMARRAASGDMFVIALLQVLRKVAAKPTHAVQPTLRAAMLATPAATVFTYGGTRIEFTVRPGALHRLLPPASLGAVRDGGTPATERGLVDALRRVQPLLSGIGVEVRDKTYGSKTLLQFDFDLGAIND